MKKYKRMYVSSYSEENFYIEKFEMGADAYRESFDGDVERLRVISILSGHKFGNVEEAFEPYGCDYDYDVIFTHENTTYCVAFESDCEIDELPEMVDLIYC